MVLLGLDIGSSSVKASIVDVDSRKCIGSAFYPKREMDIISNQPGWAEQEPEVWWKYVIEAINEAVTQSKRKKEDIKAIGISYQMHGLVIVDKEQNVLRPSIIWCDSRAVDIGNSAFQNMGQEKCLSRMLNSPGNFTASKLKWVKENEPEIYRRIYKAMLPGDYISMKLSGEINTTATGLSEGIFYDFRDNNLSQDILNQYGFSKELIPDIAPVFGIQAEVSKGAAEQTGIPAGTKIAYRAGDQPNNAFSLNVLQPGEVAATAGTSGVIYGVSDEIKYDPQSRVNTFAHVNHTPDLNRLGVLLCINGTGILNSWIKHNISDGRDYDEINKMASKIPTGSEGLLILPFGNGAERMLNNTNIGSYLCNLNFNIHSQSHIYRAAQEGIAFAFKYGMDILKETGIDPTIIRAGHANMFLSDLFRSTLSNLTGALIELYDTDGSVGAALGAGFGSNIYASYEEVFKGLNIISTIEPVNNEQKIINEIYIKWQDELNKHKNNLLI